MYGIYVIISYLFFVIHHTKSSVGHNIILWVIKKEKIEIAMFFCVNRMQSTILNKTIITNARIQQFANRAIVAWLNYNNATRFSKFFKFFPLSFDIFVSIEQIITIRFCDFSINVHSQRNYNYYNRFHKLYPSAIKPPK
nr:MAG TPA_asm: hypothetical protein [Caudoviricetes sp.]